MRCENFKRGDKVRLCREAYGHAAGTIGEVDTLDPRDSSIMVRLSGHNCWFGVPGLAVPLSILELFSPAPPPVPEPVTLAKAEDLVTYERGLAFSAARQQDPRFTVSQQSTQQGLGGEPRYELGDGLSGDWVPRKEHEALRGQLERLKAATSASGTKTTFGDVVGERDRLKGPRGRARDRPGLLEARSDSVEGRPAMTIGPMEIVAIVVGIGLIVDALWGRVR